MIYMLPIHSIFPRPYPPPRPDKSGRGGGAVRGRHIFVGASPYAGLCRPSGLEFYQFSGQLVYRYIHLFLGFGEEYLLASFKDADGW